MLLSSLPFVVRIALLAIGGAIIGAFVNWAIYAWAFTQKRTISPWMKPGEDERERTAQDRIPILGWLGRRSETEPHGKGFWIRPLLIEVCFAIGLPWFYGWQTGGGLTGGVLAMPASLPETWFYAHTILITLMCIGTFIDFDEQMIPDEVTIPGTIIGLLFAAFAPWFLLPEVATGGLGGTFVQSVNYATPFDISEVGLHNGTKGLAIALGIFAIWIWALWPKLSIWYVGFWKPIRFMYAYAMQPKRKTKCDIRIKQRQMPIYTKLLCLLFVIGMAGISLASMYLPPENWQALFSSFVGMAFGGGIVWAVRIVGTYALQQEAMGFGDVTLMVMIGAFLGWQAALLVFVIAPFAALLIAIIQLILKRVNAIAFGPYLCTGALVLIFSWSSMWPRSASGIFILGPILFWILGGSLVLMALMLAGLAWIKGSFREEEEASETVH